VVHPPIFPYNWTGMRVLASERVVTRLGESVFRNGILAQEALELTCTVLARMAQQYQKLDAST